MLLVASSKRITMMSALIAAAFCLLLALRPAQAAGRGQHVRRGRREERGEKNGGFDAAAVPVEESEWQDEQFVDLLKGIDLDDAQGVGYAGEGDHALLFTTSSSSPQGFEQDKEDEDPHLQHRALASPTNIYIRNQCTQTIQVLVATRTCNGSDCQYSGGQYVINPSSTTPAVAAIAPAGSDEYFIYALSTGGWESKGNPSKNPKDECFGGDLCLKHWRLPNANAASYTHSISCNGQSGSPATPTTTTPKPPKIGISIGNGNIGSNGPDSTPSNTIELDWLTQHNTRRATYHKAYGKSYRQLKWSNKLRDSAQKYADSLIKLSGCQVKHNHNGNRYGGENLARRYGHRGIPRPTPSSTLWGWVEREEPLSSMYQKLHWSQVLWRSTQYVGCAEATKYYGNGNGKVCYIQVCRYVAPGNCGANDPESQAFINAMLADTSPSYCNPKVP